MKYKVISADCHIDLIWLPPDLFSANASAAMQARMPYVSDGPKGPVWVTRAGAQFGLVNGMGSAGREYKPGEIHRSDRMAATGLYDDGKAGIRRLTDPGLRLKDQERDGVQAEVLYGILGSGMRMNDPEAALEMYRIYNEWLAGFCNTHPERYAGLASIPNHPIDAAVAEIERVTRRGGIRGLEIANHPDMTPLWDPIWEPVWSVAEEAGLPVHFHTLGGRMPDASAHPVRVRRAAFAVFITGFGLATAGYLMSLIYAGVLERHPRLKVVIGEAGIGWIPYVLEHMDLEWEEQFADLGLSMKPSDYWRRQIKATYQTDRIGIKLLQELGEECIMWGSDFPHPDGVWPDSQEIIRQELGHLPPATRYKVTCENAARLYGFALE